MNIRAALMNMTAAHRNYKGICEIFRILKIQPHTSDIVEYSMKFIDTYFYQGNYGSDCIGCSSSSNVHYYGCYGHISCFPLFN